MRQIFRLAISERCLGLGGGILPQSGIPALMMTDLKAVFKAVGYTSSIVNRFQV